MAKRMKSKIQPAVMKMTFEFNAGGSGKETNYIDISQCACLLNRRFYRQGLNWAVSRIKVLTAEGTSGFISIHKLPNTWVMSNAWEKGFRTWMKMNKEALDETDSIRPKFMDFKIYANTDHHNSGFANNLLPKSAATLTLSQQQANSGEWDSSKFVIPDTTDGATGGIENREVIAVGASYPGTSAATGLGAVSLIEGYAASRALPNVVDPNIPGDSMDVSGSAPENWMAALFNEGTQQDAQVLSDMVENNIAPYPFEDDGTNTDTMYPGGANQLGTLEIHSQEFITTTTVGGTTILEGGNFPCGLIEVMTAGFRAQDGFTLELTLVPGSHRGYLAESMTEM